MAVRGALAVPQDPLPREDGVPIGVPRDRRPGGGLPRVLLRAHRRDVLRTLGVLPVDAETVGDRMPGERGLAVLRHGEIAGGTRAVCRHRVRVGDRPPAWLRNQGCEQAEGDGTRDQGQAT